MAVTIPAAINLHTTDHDLDALARSDIGAPASVALKTAGNLPITTNAAQYINNVVGNIAGLAWDVPTAFDSTANTKVLIWGWQFNAPNRMQVDTVANQGIIFRIYSGTGNNYRQFEIGGNDTPAASSQGGPLPLVIDPQGDGFATEVGTFDPTDVSGYGFGSRRLNIAGGSTTLAFFIRAFLFDTEQGGSLPTFTGAANFDDIVTAVLGTDFTNKIHTFVSRAGSTYTLLCPFQIGDGATATTFNDNGATVLSPSNNDPSDPRFQLSDQAMRVHLQLTAADSVTLSGTYIWGIEADFNFNSSVGAAVDLTGATFNNMGNISLGSDVTTGNAIFNLGGTSEVIDADATLDSVVINGALRLSTLRDLNGVNADRVITDQGGTYNFTGCTIGEIENQSGAPITVISDSAIPIQTPTSGTITVIDSLFSFEGIDSWSLFNSAGDRDTNSNVQATGTGAQVYNFAFVGGTTYFFRVVSSGTTYLIENTPVASGETVISLDQTALLQSLNDKIGPQIKIG